MPSDVQDPSGITLPPMPRGCNPDETRDAAEMALRAAQAAGLLKALSHEGRLMILCHLSAGEKSVTELENLLEQRQAAVSQQLARLRADGLVKTRRDGKAIHYSLSDPRAERVVALLYEMFCAADGAPVRA